MNNRAQQIPVSDRTEGIKELDFSREPVPMGRALGVQWCIESDTFNFTLSLRDRPCTRRGILSTISSIYDLLGFVAPVLLEGKTILQELCRNNTGWDDPVPNDIQSKWFKWKSELEDLQRFAIPRCYKPINFGRVVRAEIHHFSDACFKGYGQCSYLRMVNENGKICYSFVLGKLKISLVSSNHLVARAHSSGPIGRSPQKVKGGAGHRDNRRRQTAKWSSVTSLTASDVSTFLKRWSRGQENCVSRYYCHTILANHGRPIDILFGLATRLEGNCHMLPICAPITK